MADFGWLGLALAGFGWLGMALVGLGLLGLAFGWKGLTVAGFVMNEQKAREGTSVHVRLQNKFPSYIGSRLWRWLGLALADHAGP